MGKALFYHLTRSAAQQLLPTLLGKSLQAGWRVELRGADRARMERLDEALWQGEGFLPHGLEGGAHDAVQPVLLTAPGAPGAVAGATAAGGQPPDPRDISGPKTGFVADCLIVLDGAAVDAAECAGLERVSIVFDGNDPAAVDGARAQWRALTAAGIEAQYWSEAGGRWEQKASSPARSAG